MNKQGWIKLEFRCSSTKCATFCRGLQATHVVLGGVGQSDDRGHHIRKIHPFSEFTTNLWNPRFPGEPWGWWKWSWRCSPAWPVDSRWTRIPLSAAWDEIWKMKRQGSGKDVKLERMLKSDPILKPKYNTVNAVEVFVSSSEDDKTPLRRNKMLVLFVKKPFY